MDVVFFGSGAFGLPTLQHLARAHSVTAVITQPDRKAGRGAKLTPTPIGAWAGENLADAPMLKPERVSEPDVIETVRALDADAWVIIAYGQKLSPELLADRFAINLHASLLPRWRGAAPINWAIIEGDTETGNSVITLADRMDAGLILGQSRRPIEPTVTTGELHDLLAEDGPDLVDQVLSRHADRTLDPLKQDEALVTHARKLSKSDATLDFGHSAEACRNKIHGQNPWPGVVVQRADEPLKLLRAEAVDANPESVAAPGVLLDADQGLVACANDTVLQLIEVQPAGKRPMTWFDFARGRSLVSGDRLIGETDSTC